jgi:15-cis-phytoene synthase
VSTEVSEQITQRSASNLALAFIVLPRPKRAAMSALYAFCREVDDVADEDSRPVDERRQRLSEWREDVRVACDGGNPRFPVNRELQPVISEFRLPFRLFHELIQGVEMDLTQTRYPDETALETYCYHVASVVGLLSIEIFGYTDPGCRDYAVHLGKALQLTNILRDVGNDAVRGRIYIPEDQLRRFGVTADEILNHQPSERFQALARWLASRARDYFARSRASLPATERRNMVAAELMGSVYWRLLRVLEKEQFPVLSSIPVRLSKATKISVILRAWMRVKTGLPLAAYGR